MAVAVEPTNDLEKEAASARPPAAKPWQLFRFATPLDWAIMFFGGLAALGSGALMPIMAVIFGDSIDASAPTAGGSVLDTMMEVVINFAYFCVAQAILGGCWQTCWLYTSGRQAARLRKAYFAAVIYQDISWFDLNDPAELPTRMAAEVQTVQEAIGTKFGMIFVCMAQFVGGLIVAFTRGDEGWKLSLVICTAIPLFAISGVYFAKVMGSATGEKQEAYGKAGAIAEEVLMAMRTVASFGGEQREVDRYCRQLAPAKRRGIITGFHMGAAFGMIMGAFAFTYALAFWYAANELTSSGADVILVFFAVIIGVMSLNDLGDPAVKLSAGCASGGRILQTLKEKPVIEVGRAPGISVGGPKAEELHSGLDYIQQITFDNVHFTYPSRPDVPILKGLSLTIVRGQKVALVGESGSGKSTAIQLLERFYDPAQGSVKVRFQAMECLLRALPLDWWRKQIGYVGQEPVLFATSVERNITGNDSSITQQDVIKAAKQAMAYEFLSKLPEKFNTYVGVGGGQMSGGQKQRIAIARALVKKPQILLLDEATSALDNESEKQVQATIDGLQESNEGLTTVSIAHRLSTIKNCTNIYFLKMGAVMEEGSHEKLMAMEGEYFKLVKTQTSAEGEEGLQVADLAQQSDLQRQQSEETAGDSKRESSKLGDSKQNPDGGTDAVTTRQSEQNESEILAERLKKLKEEKYSPPMCRLFRMSKPEWWALPIALVGPLLSGGGLPAMGYLLSQAIADFYIPIRDERIDAINVWAMWFLFVGIGEWLGEILKWSVFAFIQESLALRIRIKSFKAFVTQDIGFFDDPENKPLGLTTLLESQAKQITGLTGISLGNAVGSLMGLVTGLALAFLGSWKLTLACIALIPVVGAAVTIVMMVQLGIDGGNGGGYSVAGSISGEAILNIRTVRALSAEDLSLQAFSAVVDEVSAKLDGILSAVKKGVAFGFGNSVQFTLYILGFWYGAKLIDDGEIGQGDMYQSMFCVMFGLFGAGLAMAFAPDFAKGKLAAYDIFKLLDRESKVDAINPKGPNLRDMGDGSIAFQGVTFHYPHRPELPVLRGLDFSVSRGQTVALVGPSGSGKSTVIQLLQRFYDPSGGSVLIGGVPLTNLDVSWWRRQVALVGQEPVLFDMSLLENVKYSKPDATQEEVEAAARKANMDYVFNGKMSWTDSVGIRGGKLSGGQKQRCAIARAVLRDPTVLLLDEATSALDSVSEKEVQKALDAARAGRTTFTIAHRLSTIQDSDVIMVINQGKLEEKGTHHELLSKQGLYFTLAKRGAE